MEVPPSTNAGAGDGAPGPLAGPRQTAVQRLLRVAAGMFEAPYAQLVPFDESDPVSVGLLGDTEPDLRPMGQRIPPGAALVAASPSAVRADEARWCAMLARRIRCLGDDPSRKTGSFRDKALAISNPIDRLAFLNRGQAWVVRKLEALMPRVRDEGLHGDLREMLDSHCRNIQLAEALLQSVRPQKGER